MIYKCIFDSIEEFQYKRDTRNIHDLEVSEFSNITVKKLKAFLKSKQSSKIKKKTKKSLEFDDESDVDDENENENSSKKIGVFFVSNLAEQVQM